MTVNYDAIRAWDAWLRDPEHKQADGKLRAVGREKSYCCLGGLCEVAKASGLKGTWFKTPETKHWVFGRKRGDYQATGGVLPGFVADWMGPNSEFGTNPLLAVPDSLLEKVTNKAYFVHGKISATSLNDTFHFTFPEIADCVRATWPEAFDTDTVATEQQ